MHDTLLLGCCAIACSILAHTWQKYHIPLTVFTLLTLILCGVGVASVFLH